MDELHDWEQIRPWRVQTRKALLDQRMGLAPRDRKERGERARNRLLETVQWEPTAVLGIYWPIRGEIDVLDIAREHIRRGGVAALPVVTQKNAAVEFWKWDPMARMERGFWNIPVPAIAERVRPDVLIIPLVGFDAAGYRLGYGGGYYDATLAELRAKKPVVAAGLAYAQQAVLFALPAGPHDQRLDWVITPLRARRFE